MMTRMACYLTMSQKFPKLYGEYLYIKLFLPEDLVDKNTYYIAVVQLHGALEEILNNL